MTTAICLRTGTDAADGGIVALPPRAPTATSRTRPGPCLGLKAVWLHTPIGLSAIWVPDETGLSRDPAP
jgi:hypothetical protein